MEEMEGLERVDGEGVEREGVAWARAWARARRGRGEGEARARRGRGRAHRSGWRVADPSNLVDLLKMVDLAVQDGDLLAVSLKHTIWLG